MVIIIGVKISKILDVRSFLRCEVLLLLRGPVREYKKVCCVGEVVDRLGVCDSWKREQLIIILIPVSRHDPGTHPLDFLVRLRF